MQNKMVVEWGKSESYE